MDTVTIRVSKALRDEVRALAKEDGLSVDEYLRKFVNDDKNRRAKEGMVQAMKTNSPDQSYLKEAEEWQSDRFS